MPRQSEAVYVFDSALEDATVNERLERYAELLGTPGDMTVDHWGRRQLAYPIGRKENGYYIVAKFDAEPTTLPEFERALKLDDGVVRYLVTLYENEVGAPPMTPEELEAQRRRDSDDDEDEE